MSLNRFPHCFLVFLFCFPRVSHVCPLWFRVFPLFLSPYCSEAHRKENGMHPQGVPSRVQDTQQS